jgi:hypothetical protein
MIPFPFGCTGGYGRVDVDVLYDAIRCHEREAWVAASENTNYSSLSFQING